MCRREWNFNVAHIIHAAFSEKEFWKALSLFTQASGDTTLLVILHFTCTSITYDSWFTFQTVHLMIHATNWKRIFRSCLLFAGIFGLTKNIGYLVRSLLDNLFLAVSDFAKVFSVSHPLMWQRSFAAQSLTVGYMLLLKNEIDKVLTYPKAASVDKKHLVCNLVTFG